jgi:hypothetical protein
MVTTLPLVFCKYSFHRWLKPFVLIDFCKYSFYEAYVKDFCVLRRLLILSGIRPNGESQNPHP